jgi:hypothetical protein
VDTDLRNLCASAGGTDRKNGNEKERFDVSHCYFLDAMSLTLVSYTIIT